MYMGNKQQIKPNKIVGSNSYFRKLFLNENPHYRGGRNQ